MLISTRGRYAIRVLLDLAEHQNDGYIAMKAVAERQGLSLKYIQAIMPTLSKNKLIEGVHGKGGGYRLSKPLSEYRIGDILRLTEGNLAPVTCLECDAKPCNRKDTCPTLPMWTKAESGNLFFEIPVSLIFNRQIQACASITKAAFRFTNATSRITLNCKVKRNTCEEMLIWIGYK